MRGHPPVSACCGVFKNNKEFVVELADAWEHLQQFRLYVCAMCNLPVCSDGTRAPHAYVCSPCKDLGGRVLTEGALCIVYK